MWAERMVDELTGQLWAKMHSATREGTCPLCAPGTPWIGIHSHQLTNDPEVPVVRLWPEGSA